MDPEMNYLYSSRHPEKRKKKRLFPPEGEGKERKPTASECSGRISCWRQGGNSNKRGGKTPTGPTRKKKISQKKRLLKPQILRKGGEEKRNAKTRGKKEKGFQSLFTSERAKEQKGTIPVGPTLEDPQKQGEENEFSFIKKKKEKVSSQGEKICVPKRGSNCSKRS